MAFNNLPGFNVVLKDSKMLAPMTTNVVRTERVLLIGRAEDGPIEQIVNVDRVDVGLKLFGGLSEKTEIGRAIVEAFEGGCNSVSVFRIGATEATLKIKGKLESEAETNVITLVGKGKKYNDYKVEATADKLIVEKDNGVRVNLPYSITDGAKTTTLTYNDFVLMINSADIGLEARLEDSGLAQDPVELVVAPATALTGGLNGDELSDEDYITAMEAAYDLLLDYEVDFVVPLGVFVTVSEEESIDPNYANAVSLARHCYESSGRSGMKHGIIAVKPLKDNKLATVAKAVNSLKAGRGNFIHTDILDDEGLPVDTGSFVSIVFAEPIFNNLNLNAAGATGAVSYAAKLSSLAPESAATNKVFEHMSSLKFQLSPKQLDDLGANHIVTFRYKPGRGVVVTDDVTCAGQYSDYTQLSTVRIVNAAVNLVKSVCDPYIGEAGSPQLFNAMNTAIESALSSMKAAGALVDFKFAVIADPVMLARGQASVVLQLVPAFELRQITTVVRINATL